MSDETRVERGRKWPWRVIFGDETVEIRTVGRIKLCQSMVMKHEEK